MQRRKDAKLRPVVAGSLPLRLSVRNSFWKLGLVNNYDSN